MNNPSYNQAPPMPVKQLEFGGQEEDEEDFAAMRELLRSTQDEVDKIM